MAEIAPVGHRPLVAFDHADRPVSPQLERAFEALWAEFEWLMKVPREGRERYGL